MAEATLVSAPYGEGAPAPSPALCGPCAAESARWLDTSPVTLLPRFSLAYGSGAAYDASPAGIAERRSARHAEWAALVRRQRALVAAGCRAGRHARRLVRHWPGEEGPECGETEFRFPRDFALTTDQEVTCPRCRLVLGLDTSQSRL